MRLNKPLDKILNNEIKVQALRVFCQDPAEVSGRQIAALVGVTPKTAHEILQDLLREGVLIMRIIGKTHLFRLNEGLIVVKDVLKPLFAAENILSDRLFAIIRAAVMRSPLKDSIMSIGVFGSIHTKTERSTSDLDLIVIVKTAEIKIQAEKLFSEIDQKTSAQWGNLISPYINTVAEFRSKAKMRTGVIPEILKSYQLIYGARLEKLLR